MVTNNANAPDRRIFAIGDIHGRLDSLTALLGRLDALDPTARLIFMGDYLDRGPQASQVIDCLLSLRLSRPDAVFLMGNHEAAAARYAKSKDPEDLRLLRSMGFQATLDSYGVSPGATGLDFMPGEHREFLRGLHRWHREPGYVFFHAPLWRRADPEVASPRALEDMLFNRTIDRDGWATGGETLVFGHVPFETPLAAPGLLGIDTGAGSGRLLTAVELPEVRFHHA
jgi:serine/threonine protein phosphatase 1